MSKPYPDFQLLRKGRVEFSWGKFLKATAATLRTPKLLFLVVFLVLLEAYGNDLPRGGPGRSGGMMLMMLVYWTTDIPRVLQSNLSVTTLQVVCAGIVLIGSLTAWYAVRVWLRRRQSR